MTRNFYAVLRLGPDASPREIRSAYQRQALDNQPDQPGNNPNALKNAQQAYRVLADPERRRAYDLRQQTSRAEPLIPPSQAQEQQSRRRAVSLAESFETHQPSFAELFDRFWSNFEGVARPKAEQVESLTIEIPLSPAEAEAGGRTRILIPARAQCPGCGGHGAVGGYECWQCSGQGSITAEHPLDVVYPRGLKNEHIARVPLNQFGIENFYLTVRFRVTESAS